MQVGNALPINGLINLTGAKAGMLGAKSCRDVGNLHPYKGLRNNLSHKVRISSEILEPPR